jgi:proteasome lid subunit RPN8/RPN11
MSVLRLSHAVYESIRSHAEQTYPNECCGALLGQSTRDGWQIHSAVPAVNATAASARSRYEIAPRELVKIDREASRQGLAIAGFYHSHPDHPAQWSPTDLAEAHWLGCSYVITAVVQGKATVTNSFLLAGANEEGKHFESQTIRILEYLPSLEGN